MPNYYAAIDLKSFYAAVECNDRHLNMFMTPLVVCDTRRGEGTIILATSPYLRHMGIPSRLRRKNLPKDIPIIYARPRMARYLEVSAEFNRLLLEYVGEDDLHIYSIDECFINIGPYLKLYRLSAKELIKKILHEIEDRLGLIATAGLGPNMFLAKVSMDIEAKHSPDNIAQWDQKDIETKLWPLTPLSKVWGISSGYEKKLNNLGLLTMGDIAHYPKTTLKFYLGVVGETFWERANGIDDTNIREKYSPLSTSISVGQTLEKDYSIYDARRLLMEMNDDLARRLRRRGDLAQAVSISLTYSSAEGNYQNGTRLLLPTDITYELDAIVQNLTLRFDNKKKIRGLSIAYFNLISNTCCQLGIFDDEKKEDERIFDRALDKIKARFGSNAILRSSSLLKNSTARRRNEEIGGHAR